MHIHSLAEREKNFHADEQAHALFSFAASPTVDLGRHGTASKTKPVQATIESTRHMSLCNTIRAPTATAELLGLDGSEWKMYAECGCASYIQYAHGPIFTCLTSATASTQNILASIPTAAAPAVISH